MIYLQWFVYFNIKLNFEIYYENKNIDIEKKVIFLNSNVK